MQFSSSSILIQRDYMFWFTICLYFYIFHNEIGYQFCIQLYICAITAQNDDSTVPVSSFMLRNIQKIYTTP